MENVNNINKLFIEKTDNINICQLILVPKLDMLVYLAGDAGETRGKNEPAAPHMALDDEQAF